MDQTPELIAKVGGHVEQGQRGGVVEPALDVAPGAQGIRHGPGEPVRDGCQPGLQRRDQRGEFGAVARCVRVIPGAVDDRPLQVAQQFGGSAKAPVKRRRWRKRVQRRQLIGQDVRQQGTYATAVRRGGGGFFVEQAYGAGLAVLTSAGQRSSRAPAGPGMVTCRGRALKSQAVMSWRSSA